MDRHEREVAEVDRLVQSLGTGAGAQPPDPASPGRAIGRWTNVTMHMPSPRKSSGDSRVLKFVETLGQHLETGFLKFVAAVVRVRRFVRMPGATTIVRGWVALAAVYGGALFFWPYPKTYFWGLVGYQLCLALSLVAGAWGARLSWDARLGAAHTVALGTVIWAITLGTTNAVAVVRGDHAIDTPTFAHATYSPAMRLSTPATTRPATRARG